MEIEVFDDILKQVLREKATNNIAVEVEQGTIKSTGCAIWWFLTIVCDSYTKRPYPFFFSSNMSDDELDDTYGQFQEKISLLRNLNTK